MEKRAKPLLDMLREVLHCTVLCIHLYLHVLCGWIAMNIYCTMLIIAHFMSQSEEKAAKLRTIVARLAWEEVYTTEHDRAM